MWLVTGDHCLLYCLSTGNQSLLQTHSGCELLRTHSLECRQEYQVSGLGGCIEIRHMLFPVDVSYSIVDS